MKIFNQFPSLQIPVIIISIIGLLSHITQSFSQYRSGRIRGGGGMAINTISPSTSSSSFECDCRKYTPRIPRIIKGKPVEGTIPWQARLERFNFKGTNSFDYVCSGVLVSSRFLITAGHCLTAGINTDAYQVVLGTHSLYNNKTQSRTYRVSDFVKHRGHHELVPNDNDIAILKLEDEYGQGVRCDMTVQPICIGGPTFPPGSKCVTSGWGSTETDHLSEKLLYATVELHSHETCQNVHSQHDDHFNDNYVRRVGSKKLSMSNRRWITKNMICAGPGPHGADSCHGDSGGPLYCFDNQNVAYLTGITSWGKTCGTKASVYTKVSQYKDWIKMEMQLMG